MGRLFWKIFFAFWLTLLLITSAVGVLVWQHNKERIEQLEGLVDSPRADMSLNSAANILQHEGAGALEAYLQQRHIRHQRPSRMLIVNDSGTDLLGRPVPASMLNKAREALNTPKQSSVRQATTPEDEQFILFIPRRDHSGAQRPSLLPSLLPRYIPVFPLWVVFIGSLLFSAGLAWYITRPIRLLREATNSFAEGRLNTRVMPKIGKRRDEITDLARDFDHMAEQVQQLISVQRRLLNDVSHELRSPLARLQMAIEMGRQQPEKLDEMTLRVEKESQRLDELVGELLALSRLEASVDDGHKQNDYFDITGLLGSIVDDARFEAQSQHKQVIFKPKESVLINGSIELLRRAFENVIRNAIFYTPENSEVEIRLNEQDGSVGITVCDQGKGVNEEKLSQLFVPFVRVNEDQQNVKIPGYGLGLAIAQRAIEIHRGNITAYNHEQGGLCIAMCLPM